jgi:hypothetical protein
VQTNLSFVMNVFLYQQLKQEGPHALAGAVASSPQRKEDLLVEEVVEAEADRHLHAEEVEAVEAEGDHLIAEEAVVVAVVAVAEPLLSGLGEAEAERGAHVPVWGAAAEPLLSGSREAQRGVRVPVWEAAGVEEPGERHAHYEQAAKAAHLPE